MILAGAINIIPAPLSVMEDKGSFKLKGNSISCDSSIGQNAKDAVAAFSAQLTLCAGNIYPVSQPSGLAQTVKEGKAKGIVFCVDPTLKDEAYHIRISKDAAIIEASSENGFLYAIQSLKQMLPVAIWGSKAAEDQKWELPCCEIKDKPRFAYRGMHLDCSRHFFSTDEIKKVLDQMAILKLNRFHWHLTDDQGWRAEIKKYPRLIEVGAYRSGTMVGYYTGPSDNIRYGGYYTQEEMREIVAYAQKLGITVVPEVDLPGHMVAALASYPELGCFGGPYEVWTMWGVSPDVLCPGKEQTFTFLCDVLDELCEIFPGEYFHIGGDECPKDNWAKCPDCQAKIQELGLVADEHASAETRLQNYVTSRIQAHLKTKGKKIIGWDEILEGELEEGATVMSWRGLSGGIEASNRNFDVIMTPTDYCYFDYCQDPAKQESDEPLCAFWGDLTLEKVYSFDPTAGLNPQAAAHILGAQANVWTEYIPDDAQLEYMIMPRLLAMSEVQWCELKNKNFANFESKVKEFAFPRLELQGFNFRNK